MTVGIQRNILGRAFSLAASFLPVAAAGFLAAGDDARAGGFEIREESAEGMGDAFAGETAKAYGANTAYYNPAGMTLLTGHAFAQTASGILPNVTFSGTNTGAAGSGGAATSGSTGGQAAQPVAVGSTFGVIDVEPDLKIGLSVAVPFGLRTSYDSGWLGRYQALTSGIIDYEFQPSVAYRVNEHLSIGGGPRISYLTAKMSHAVNQTRVGQGDGKQTVTGTSWAGGYTVGLLYEFDTETRVGVNYRSRILHRVEGDIKNENLSPFLGVVDQSVKAKLMLPDKLTVGVYHQINDRLALISDISWTNWSLWNSLTIVGARGAGSTYPYNWHDTIFASLGANYRLDERWVVRAGVAYDQTPTRGSSRDARFPDSDRYWLSAGASYFITPKTSLHLGYAHIFMDDAKVNYSANTNPVIGSGRLSGTYSSGVDLISASMSFSF